MGLWSARPCFTICSILVLLIACGIDSIQRTIWWSAYDPHNCESCSPRIDWKRASRQEVGDVERAAFAVDGVAVMKGALLDTALISELGAECDHLSDTFLTSVVAKFLLKFYLRYEHRLETRSEMLRDWAVHGPFGKWAAQLLNASEVRLYNTELIFHRGSESPTCKPAWHRDTVAAPFAPEVPSVVFNIYLHDIDAEHDGLIYVRRSHVDPSSMPDVIDIVEPNISVGDVLVHSANSYHTTSGRGCFKRRSLQFRYFAGAATLAHGPMRQSGPIPWTFAHAPGVAPHGLKLGDPLQGPWYPLVHPKPLVEEQRSVPEAKSWGILSLSRFVSDSASVMNTSTGKPAPGFVVMDGVVKNPDEWDWKPMGDTGMMLPSLKKAGLVPS